MFFADLIVSVAVQSVGVIKVGYKMSVILVELTEK